MTNAEIARIFRDIAVYLEMEAVPFKPRAYEKAADVIDGLDRPLTEIYAGGGRAALEALPGIGKHMAASIAALVTAGHLAAYDELRTRMPIDIAALTAIEGLGPKHLKALYERLGIHTVDDLERAARAHKISALPHFGVRSEAKLLRGIAFVRASHGRLPLGHALPVVEEIRERLAAHAHVTAAHIAGSIRRRRETIGDADVLVVAADPHAVVEFITRMPEVIGVHARGATKTSVRLRIGVDLDVRIVPADCVGAALLYFTGSKAHNVALRRRAQNRGLKLNEYGIFRGTRRIAAATEADVYRALDLPCIPPELREDQGEIEAADSGRLPSLIADGDLRGDLQIQTSWTDGADSIEAMAVEARRYGLDYIAITDHTRGLAVTGGSDAATLRRQIREIARLNRRLDGITVLTGAEVNITKDGTLDIDDETLSELDVVGVAVHSHFGLSRAAMTARIVRAMRNPHADILFHPTGRVLNRREAYEIDIDTIITEAKQTGTILEVDGHPERLDLCAEHIRRATAAGVKLTIDSDAHRASHIRFLSFGIGQARRGWATKADVLNTLPLAPFLGALKQRGHGRPTSRRTARPAREPRRQS